MLLRNLLLHIPLFGGVDETYVPDVSDEGLSVFSTRDSVLSERKQASIDTRKTASGRFRTIAKHKLPVSVTKTVNGVDTVVQDYLFAEVRFNFPESSTEDQRNVSMHSIVGLASQPAAMGDNIVKTDWFAN